MNKKIILILSFLLVFSFSIFAEDYFVFMWHYELYQTLNEYINPDISNVKKSFPSGIGIGYYMSNFLFSIDYFENDLFYLDSNDHVFTNSYIKGAYFSILYYFPFQQENIPNRPGVETYLGIGPTISAKFCNYIDYNNVNNNLNSTLIDYGLRISLYSKVDFFAIELACNIDFGNLYSEKSYNYENFDVNYYLRILLFIN